MSDFPTIIDRNVMYPNRFLVTEISSPSETQSIVTIDASGAQPTDVEGTLINAELFSEVKDYIDTPKDIDASQVTSGVLPVVRGGTGESQLDDTITGTSTGVPTSQAVYELVDTVRGGGIIYRGTTIESTLPTTGQLAGDYWSVTDFDVTDPGRDGHVIWNSDLSEWDKNIDQVLNVDGTTITLNSSGAVSLVTPIPISSGGTGASDSRGAAKRLQTGNIPSNGNGSMVIGYLFIEWGTVQVNPSSPYPRYTITPITFDRTYVVAPMVVCNCDPINKNVPSNRAYATDVTTTGFSIVTYADSAGAINASWLSVGGIL